MEPVAERTEVSPSTKRETGSEEPRNRKESRIHLTSYLEYRSLKLQWELPSHEMKSPATRRRKFFRHSPLPTEGEFTVSTSDEKKRGKLKESKGKNGDGKGRDDEFGLDDTDCDNPDDPRCIECDDSSDPLCSEEVLSQQEEVQTITAADGNSGATEDESGNTSNSNRE
jgi:hypothetical protein